MSKETSAQVRIFLDRLSAMGIMVREVKLDSEVGTWMEAKTLEKFSILFDPALDANMQANNLETLLTQTIQTAPVLSTSTSVSENASITSLFRNSIISAKGEARHNHRVGNHPTTSSLLFMSDLLHYNGTGMREKVLTATEKKSLEGA